MFHRKKISDGGPTLVIIKKQKTLQLLLINETTRNKQTVKEKD